MSVVFHYLFKNNLFLFKQISRKSPVVASMAQPKGVHSNWDMKVAPKDLLKNTEELINRCRKIYDQVGSQSNDAVCYESVIKVLRDVELEYYSRRREFKFPQHVSVEKSLRDASAEADKKLNAFVVEISMRQDIFEKLMILDHKSENMSPESERFLKKWIKIGKRNGLHLTGDVRKEITTLQNKIIDLCVDYRKNLSEENTTLEFLDEELDGLPEDFISNLTKVPDSSKRQVTLKYPHYVPIMRKAKNPETRYKLYKAFNSQCINENTTILEELGKLRHKHAELLGYQTHADYATDVLMAKTGDNVYKFLTDLSKKLQPLWQEEKAYLLELKEKECKELGIPYDGKLNFWDMGYYTTKVEEVKYNVDMNKLREYFPLPTVTKGLLEIYQELLNLKFERIENAKVWAEDVEMYSVKDSDNHELLGYFFFDLFPREGKYSHAGMFKLQTGCLLSDGGRQVGVCAIVTNFTKATETKPSLLDHGEVTTFFHEFGHVMHFICAETEFSIFSGTYVETDFLEAPSQMLENWCWEPASLKKMSAHYSNGSEIPEDVMLKLIKSRQSNTGYFNLRQVALAMFDYKLHTRKEVETKKIYHEACSEILGIVPDKDTNFAASFGHMVNRYDAQYYGYLWSEVYSMDMFCTRFKDGNLLSPSVGKDYRDKILKPGGSKDAKDMLVDFLGREPTQDAFLLCKGLKIEQ